MNLGVPDKNLNSLPEKLDIIKSAISEPAAVSLHAVELGLKNLVVPVEDAQILIIGGGAIGILSALILENLKKNQKINSQNKK